MKKKILIASLLMVSALCITSCGNKAVTEVIDTQDTAEEYVIPEKDDDGNKIEIVEVTDAEGAVVTDADSKPVTELAIVDEKGAVITDANGQNAKPNIKSTPKPAAANNNNNNNNNSNNNSSDNNNSGSVDYGNSNNSTSDSSLSRIAFLWFGDSTKKNDNVVFDCLKQDDDVMEITFKIKDDAKDGKYEIKLYKDSQYSTSFVGQEVNDIPVEFCTGAVGVNTSVSDTQAGSGCSFVISSVSGKPGDTVTVKCSLKNVNQEIAAFNSYLAYDSSALEAVSVSSTGFIASSGEFTSNIK